MSTRSTERSLRIPASLQHEVEQIFKLTDAFCAEHLDAEYGELVRKLVAKLARRRPSPLVRGDLRIWAAAAIYTVGSVNFLFDRTQKPHMTGDDLSALTGVPKSTLANKAKLIRDVLRIGQLDRELCRRELLASNPLAWMISVNGFIVDARTMPPEVLAEARRRGLIPDLPADRMGASGGESHKGRAGPGAGGSEPDSGMTDDDDDDALCDTSFSGIGYALQVEMLDEVTCAAWRDADERKKAAAKRSPRNKGRAE